MKTFALLIISTTMNFFGKTLPKKGIGNLRDCGAALPFVGYPQTQGTKI